MYLVSINCTVSYKVDRTKGSISTVFLFPFNIKEPNDVLSFTDMLDALG